MIIKKTAKTLLSSIFPLLLSTTAYSAAVTTQTAPFHLRASVPGVCFEKQIKSALAQDGSLPPATGAAALSLLDKALAFSVAKFDAAGALKIQRHGNNGAVFELNWGALLTQASFSFVATNTNAAAAAYANALAKASSSSTSTTTGLYIKVGTLYIPALPIIAYAYGTASGGAFSVGLDSASASSMASSGTLAEAQNLAIVDAANITEAWNRTGFTSANFAFAKSGSGVSTNSNSLASVLTTAFSLSGVSVGGLVPGSDLQIAAANAAANAVAKALAGTEVSAAFYGHYKAMPGKASKTDILEAGGASAIKVKCGTNVELTVQATTTAK